MNQSPELAPLNLADKPDGPGAAMMISAGFGVFVLGFLALSALRTLGAIDAARAADLEVAARALILVALSAVGLSLRVEELRSVGPRPLLIGLGAALVIGVCTILAIVSFGLANGLVA